MRLLVTAAIIFSLASTASAEPTPRAGSLPKSVPADVFSGSRSPNVLTAQVLLDRSRFSPGVIDGYMGPNTRRAIAAFQRAKGMAVTGEVSDTLLDRLRKSESGSIVQTYTISEEDVDGPFVQIPTSMAAMSQLTNLAYESPLEMLAEKFHMDRGLLQAFNPSADFGEAGTRIVVVAPGEQDLVDKVSRIEVDKEDESVRAYSDTGALLARYPATVGSRTFPSPSGKMQVKAIAAQPKYYFDPKGREWGPNKELTIAGGPNNPIGGTWIDLSKEGYGIHGSPDPQMVAKRASHGCVRLTNWDAAELAGAVRVGATVEFM